MIHFIGFIFIFILLFLVIGISLFFRIIGGLFGLGKRNAWQETSQHRKERTAGRASGEPSHTSYSDRPSSTGKKKVFDDDEGEYIDFEEIKDD